MNHFESVTPQSMQHAHRLNATPPYYYIDLPKSGLRMILCDKPTSAVAYSNIIRIMDDFCLDTLRHKKARKFKFTSVILSEIAHVSETPMEPPHMLVKFTLPTQTGIAQSILAHIYLSGTMPKARIDTSAVFWKDPEEIAEHEIWASREAIRLRLDTSNYPFAHVRSR